MSARPIASIWPSPPDSVPACWCMRSARRGNSAVISSMTWFIAATVSRRGASSCMTPPRRTQA
ncbi:Uncharacterised protein [Bordetella pertussis]|nr:Uncharacterised protein [Bordetella pertussis]CFW03568.1 Uncharacterised protein [Bordetella pertussis]CPK61821.1 Uncharacterised protein [Bordetella pertussis]CPL06681.1 Uncharacterised protein [Bordetella pertussis]